MIQLTKHGKKEIILYIRELKAKRKEILDANKDTAYKTNIPDIQDIIDDIENIIDKNGEYYSNWEVTDNYDADFPLRLQLGKNFNM